MKTGLRKLILLTGCNLLAATAFAIPTNITSPSPAAPASDLGNFGDATVLAWLTTEVTTYNTAHNTSLPAPVNVNQNGLTTGAGGDSITLDLAGNYNYLFLHWGGKKGGWAQAYYIGGESGSFTFDAPPGGHPAVGGLSGYSFFGPGTPITTPDGGQTVLMLGAAFLGLALVSRRIKGLALIKG